MGLLLVIVGLLLWLLGGYFTLGIILLVVGLVLIFLPGDGWYGYSRWHGRRGPPV